MVHGTWYTLRDDLPLLWRALYGPAIGWGIAVCSPSLYAPLPSPISRDCASAATVCSISEPCTEMTPSHFADQRQQYVFCGQGLGFRV